MNNLVWQYNTNTQRTYDGSSRSRMSAASAATIIAYCIRHNLTYKLETVPRYGPQGMLGGPAMERFQLFEPRYDEFDNIFYVDTDVIVYECAQNIFELYQGQPIVGHNTHHKADRDILKSGWLADKVDPERYNKSYMHGCMFIASREFRVWFRQTGMLEDVLKLRDIPSFKQMWPVADQSILSYAIATSPFDLTPMSPAFEHGPQMFHAGGAKSFKANVLFLEKFASSMRGWLKFSNVEQMTINGLTLARRSRLIGSGPAHGREKWGISNLIGKARGG
jgi:hypothetical protein